MFRIMMNSIFRSNNIFFIHKDIVSKQIIRLLSTGPHILKSIPVNEISSNDIPILNNKITLVEHPFTLDGYQPKSTGDKNKSKIPILENNVFAVVEFSGTQYKVTKGDVIVADKITDIDIGSIINLDKVLLLGSKSATIIGRPFVTETHVQASVEEMAKDKKVITLKFRRRKNSKNIRGFRRKVTILRIQDIVLSDDHIKDLKVKT